MDIFKEILGCFPTLLTKPDISSKTSEQIPSTSGSDRAWWDKAWHFRNPNQNRSRDEVTEKHKHIIYMSSSGTRRKRKVDLLRWSLTPKSISCSSHHLQLQQQPDRLNSIMAVWCVETPEVRANSSVYTPESLSQTKTNTFIGFQDLVCCDCPVAFEVSHRFMLFTYSCSFSPSNHHGVFRWNNFSTVWNNVWAGY